MQDLLPLFTASCLLTSCIADSSAASEVATEGPTLSLTILHRTSFVGDAFDPRPAATQFAPFVAYQDGSGPWQTMPIVDGRYTAAITSGRYGVAVGYPKLETVISENGRRILPGRLTIQYGTIRDQVEIAIPGPQPIATPYNLIVSWNGVTGAQLALASYDRSVNMDLRGRAFVIAPASKPASDLFVTLQDSVQLDGRVEPRTLKILRMADVDVERTPVVMADFSLPLPSPTPSVFAFTPRFGTGTVATAVHNANSPETIADLGSSSRFTFTLPTGTQREGDSYVLDYTLDAAAPFTTYSGSYAVDHPESVVIDRGTPYEFTAPAVELVTAPYLRPFCRVQVADDQFPAVDYRLSVNTSEVGYSIVATSTWLRESQSNTLAVPDLSHLPTWPQAPLLAPRTKLSWTLIRSEANRRDLRPGAVVHRATAAGVAGEYCGNGKIETAFEQCDPPNRTTCSATCQSIAPPLAAPGPDHASVMVE